MKYTHDDDDDGEIDWQTDDDDLEDDYSDCPHCGGTMLKAAGHCPECGQWITDEDLPTKRKPVWILIVLALLLAATIIAVLPR